MSGVAPAWTVERLVSADELDGVLAVDAASFMNPWTRAMFARELENPEVSHIYVVRGPVERVAGYCSSWLVSDELHINNLAVRPEWRRQGAARSLLIHVLSEAHRLGARHATLEVRRSNKAARRLYEGAGFEVAGVRPGYYTNPSEDAIILWSGLLAET